MRVLLLLGRVMLKNSTAAPNGIAQIVGAMSHGRILRK
jgi:hypothetical protein